MDLKKKFFRKRHVVALFGVTAEGKTTLGGELKREGFKKIVTCTTRQMRDGEFNAVDYHFLSPRQFGQRNRYGHFLETNVFAKTGKSYGTLKKSLEDAEKSGENWVLCTELNGAKAIRKAFPKVILINVTATEEVIIERLKERGTQAAEIAARLSECEIVENERRILADLSIDNSGDRPPSEVVREIISFLEKFRSS